MDMRAPLPSHFRKLSYRERKKALQESFGFSDAEIDSISGKIDLSDLADILIETSIGTFPVPFGLAAGFLINKNELFIPMVTEEPSVIEAATMGALLVRSASGFTAEADPSVMTTQVFLYDTAPNCESNIHRAEGEIHQLVDQLIPTMANRGGGYRGLNLQLLENKVICVNIHIGVQEAMGANVVNTVAEGIKLRLSQLSGGKALMGILTNAAEKRLARASFEVPTKYFRRNELSGEEVCQRIVMAGEVANLCPERAVTNNKGIMNGISALVLATGNDTRAVEAAAHFHAQKSGTYKSLTSYRYENGMLHGTIELPIPVGTVGGSTTIWPPSMISMKILENPDARTLSAIAASVGLAQNLAAVTALVSEGIQQGHMKLHAARIAYMAGARGEEIRRFAAKLAETKSYNLKEAKLLYNKLRGS